MSDSGVFNKNIVFGNMPIGNPFDISLNAIRHFNDADIIIVEHKEEFIKYLDFININLPDENKINIDSSKLFSYSLESDVLHSQQIHRLVNYALVNNKKIFVVSDEGSSIYLEPFNKLKKHLIDTGYDFQVLPGPNAAMTLAVSTQLNFNLLFLAGSLGALSETASGETESMTDVFDKIKYTKLPTIFMVSGYKILENLNNLEAHFGQDWFADFAINLTRKDEGHIVNNIKDIKLFIENNIEFFNNMPQIQRFAIILIPNSRKEEVEFGFYLDNINELKNRIEEV